MQNSYGWVTDDAMNQAVGAEVRRRRELAGLSRPNLVEQLPFSIHIQTLHNYELGNRQVPLGRLVEICRILGTTAPEILRIAMERVDLMPTMAAQVDLRAMVDDQTAQFEPLRRWARNRLDAEPENTKVVTVHHAVVREWAVQLGVSLGTLVQHLISTSSLQPISERETTSS